MFGSVVGALTNSLQNLGTVLSIATDFELVANLSRNESILSCDGCFTPVMVCTSSAVHTSLGDTRLGLLKSIFIILAAETYNCRTNKYACAWKQNQHHKSNCSYIPFLRKLDSIRKALRYTQHQYIPDVQLPPLTALLQRESKLHLT